MSTTAIYQQILHAVEFYDYLGVAYVDGDADAPCRMQIPAEDRLQTPTGHVHGGVLTSLVDLAGLYAVWVEYGTPGGEAYTTAMEISFEHSTARGVAAHARIQELNTAGRGDELAIDVDLFELPDTHEFGTAYDPDDDPGSTLVATSDIEFVMFSDRERE